MSKFRKFITTGLLAATLVAAILAPTPASAWRRYGWFGEERLGHARHRRIGRARARLGFHGSGRLSTMRMRQRSSDPYAIPTPTAIPPRSDLASSEARFMTTGAILSATSRCGWPARAATGGALSPTARSWSGTSTSSREVDRAASSFPRRKARQQRLGAWLKGNSERPPLHRRSALLTMQIAVSSAKHRNRRRGSSNRTANGAHHRAIPLESRRYWTIGRPPLFPDVHTRFTDA